MNSLQLADIFHALCIIAFLLLIANIIKRSLLKGLIVPSSLIAGALGLVLGPQLLGQFFSLSVAGENIWITQTSVDIFKALPGYLIVIVFAGLFLGKSIPSLSESLNSSLPNLGFGYTIAIGQYVVGMIATLLIIIPFFDLQPAVGALIAVGFQGGHGTVAGLGSTFDEIGFTNGLDLGLGIATIGLISAIILGTIMSNVSNKREDEDSKAEPQIGEDDDLRKVKDRPIGLQFAILGAVIAVAWLLLSALQLAENAVFADSDVAIMKYMPLFPIAMMVGLVTQVLLNKAGVGHWSSHYQINLISNLSLDILIVSALAALDLSVLADYWQAIALLGAVGVIYSASVYFFAGSWFFQNNWKIRGLGELGQSMGTTAVGLLMLKQSSGKPQAHIKPFSYKQPLYEPVVGGGLVTALAIPTIAAIGAKAFAGIMSALLLIIVASFYLTAKRAK
uniref:sodium/glutamate symporter n=1 Tax=Ningiella ruwaisensis TaxID=2364274 RepID=UPI00109EE897|nr:sodium:glutamate symporter [Ningiella ruwaisensis]